MSMSLLPFGVWILLCYFLDSTYIISHINMTFPRSLHVAANGKLSLFVLWLSNIAILYKCVFMYMSMSMYMCVYVYVLGSV